MGTVPAVMPALLDAGFTGDWWSQILAAYDASLGILFGASAVAVLLTFSILRLNGYKLSRVVH